MLTTTEDLRQGEIEVVGLLPYASNYTFLAKLVHESDDGDESLVVYKPVEGETPLWDFPNGSLAQRELAAFLVSDAAGWNLVPPTVMRDGPLGPGAVQAFIEHDPIVTAFDLMPTHRVVLKHIAFFDLVVNNADRKAGHVLLDGDRRVWAVDHGICFHAEPKLRTVLWDFVDEPVEPRDQQAARGLLEALDEGLGLLLSTILSEQEIEALKRRAEKMAGSATFPPPGSGRAYPWPPV